MTPSHAAAAAAPAAPLVVVMGVSGCGKTTAGAALAAKLGVRYADGDDFHPQANVDKMASGTPLTDEDRWPWLYTLAGWLAGNSDRGAVLGCSALKRVYRDVLRAHAPSLIFMHLYAEPEVMIKRVQSRPGHFMPASLVESQYATLEHLEQDETGVKLYADDPVDAIIDNFFKKYPKLAPECDK